MHKDESLILLKNNFSNGEELIGSFMAKRPFKIWLFFLIGPLAVLSMKWYLIAVTNKGMHFQSLNLIGKFSQHDFFDYNEIDSFSIGRGILQITMKYMFTSGRKLKIKAQKKGRENYKINDITLDFLKNNIQQT